MSQSSRRCLLSNADCDLHIGVPLKLYVLKQVPLLSVMVKYLRVINKLISLIHLRYHFKSYSLASPLVGHQPSVELRRMLPHRMIIPSSVLKLHSSIGQGKAVNIVYTALPSLEHMALYDTGLLFSGQC